MCFSTTTELTLQVFFCPCCGCLPVLVLIFRSFYWLVNLSTVLCLWMSAVPLRCNMHPLDPLGAVTVSWLSHEPTLSFPHYGIFSQKYVSVVHSFIQTLNFSSKDIEFKLIYFCYMIGYTLRGT